MSDYLDPTDMMDYLFRFKTLEDFNRFNEICDKEGLYRQGSKSKLEIIVLSIFPDTAEWLRSQL
jgi:hypothetical protein